MFAADIYVGLMSGTSLDAVDAVAVRFTPELSLIATHTEPLPHELKQQIMQLTQPDSSDIDQLGKVDLALGYLFANAVNNLIAKTDIDKNSIVAIGSHGQTIRHRPEFGFSLQIGDANIIAENTGIKTITDFRRRDMAAGGQGAPLVPAFHQAVFQTEKNDRIILNIGGMANITFLPSDSCQIVSGFDTGPGNVLLDTWIQYSCQQKYDNNGQWAASGKTNSKLLQQLLQDSYFELPPPKSTGRERFNYDWLDKQLSSYSVLLAQDIQSTLSELTAISIAQAIERYVSSSNFELLICGGGSHNSYLLKQLKHYIAPNRIDKTDAEGVNADWVEAIAFAWLAQRCLAGEHGNKPQVTGAKGERILGAIYQA